ncbi:MAG: hypothetical protein GY839_17150 [candidate division Zixibacteria bacterium]|nr:hypothetical protein [candidate division Zixibacteria bacterium]
MARRRKKKKSNNKIVFIIPIVFGLAILWVWKSTEAHNLSRELTRIENTKKQMIEKNKLLKAELEKYRSISWIDGCARKYGLTYEVKERLVLFEKTTKRPERNRNLFAGMADIIIKGIKTVID